MAEQARQLSKDYGIVQHHCGECAICMDSGTLAHFSPAAQDLICLASTPQPPSHAGTEDVTPIAQAILTERSRIGLGKYGHPLQMNNGRLPEIDALQEAADQYQYAVQIALEVQAMRKAFHEIHALILQDKWRQAAQIAARHMSRQEKHDIEKDDKIHKEVMAAYDYVREMIPQADRNTIYPMWCGWALRAAFHAGVAWAVKHGEDAGNHNHL